MCPRGCCVWRIVAVIACVSVRGEADWIRRSMGRACRRNGRASWGETQKVTGFCKVVAGFCGEERYGSSECMWQPNINTPAGSRASRARLDKERRSLLIQLFISRLPHISTSITSNQSLTPLPTSTPTGTSSSAFLTGQPHQQQSRCHPKCKCKCKGPSARRRRQSWSTCCSPLHQSRWQGTGHRC